MKNLIYTGTAVRANANPNALKYRSTGEVNRYGDVMVIHILTGDELYFSEQEFKRLFKII